MSDTIPQQPTATTTVDLELGKGELTPEQQAEARRYGRISLICSLTDSALDLLYLGVMAFLVAGPLDAWLASFPAFAGEPSYLRLAAMILIVISLHAVVSSPLSYYSGFVVEHQFELSNQTFARWLRQWALRNGLAMGLGLVMYIGLYTIIWNTGVSWWLIAAAAFFVVNVILGQLTPVLIIPLFQTVERLDNAELQERMNRLAEGTGLTIEGVYRQAMSEDTKKANAMLAGLGPTRRVLMGDTLLNGFSLDEIEAIFAHEIGHHVYRHIPKMIFTGILWSLAGFWICDQVLQWKVSGGPVSTAPVSSLPLLMFAMTLFMLLLEPLQNIISRRYERQCDRYALERTGNRKAYRSAFYKLALLNKADLEPNPVEAFLFHSHPPIAQRLALADE